MYQRILAAVDDSPASDLALREAIGLAKDQHAKLRIVYVVDKIAIYDSTQLSPEVEKTWNDIGRGILDKARRSARAGGIEAEIKLLETEVPGTRMAEAILAEAGAWPADLVVAGTHGRTGLDHLLMGSVAEGIVRGCPVPILLVRNRPLKTAPPGPLPANPDQK
ncbi:MAG TPA: universal stress protein [Gallionella sp.]|nr:universal stress protein [Gallionella sp.]